MTGNIDEKVRHAITNLRTTILLLQMEPNRVISLGEEPESVFNTGAHL